MSILILISAVAVLVVGAVCFAVAPRYVDRRLDAAPRGPDAAPTAQERFTATTELRRLVVEAVAAALLLVGSWVAISEYQTTKAREDSERFAQAIEMLGEDEQTVRIGAVYALEGVARSDGHYYPVMDDMLTAMIRAKYPYDSAAGTSTTPPAASSDPVVQAAVRVLGRAPERPGRRLDLSRADLRNVDFLGGDFREADFTDSNLSGVNARDADFRQADFTGTAVGRGLCGARLERNPGLPPNLVEDPCS
ncbi:pentapeptide repeat-containing protein [Actinosynnema sp. NPDC059797]